MGGGGEWINVGQPDGLALGKAASRAEHVLLFPFAAPAAFLRLATAVVIEAHDEWQVTRRYLSEVSMAELRKVIAAKESAAKPVAEQRQIA